MRIVSLLPLLLLAACTRAPDYSRCRLVGTWEWTPEPKDAPKEPYSEFIEIGATGAWRARTTLEGKLHEYVTQWRLHEDKPDRVLVDLPDPNQPSRAWRTTIVFETPDIASFEDGVGDPRRYTRAKIVK